MTNAVHPRKFTCSTILNPKNRWICRFTNHFFFMGIYPQVPNVCSFLEGGGLHDVDVISINFRGLIGCSNWNWKSCWGSQEVHFMCTSLMLLPDVPGRKLRSMVNRYSYNRLISGSILYWGYNPLILSFDPNFLGHPSSSFLPEICRSLFW